MAGKSFDEADQLQIAQSIDAIRDDYMRACETVPAALFDTEDKAEQQAAIAHFIDATNPFTPLLLERLKKAGIPIPAIDRLNLEDSAS